MIMCPIDGGPTTFPFKLQVINEHPLILLSVDFASIPDLLFEFRDHKVVLFLICSWNFSRADVIDQAESIQKISREYREHRICHLANSFIDKAILDARAIPNIHCNQNCFLDERIFKPRPNIAPTFRAIYDARLTPFKRHHLASGISELALIAYTKQIDYDGDYLRSVYRILHGATWLTGPFSKNGKYRDTNEIAQLTNLGRSGIILSADEGANWASIQYLLSGLPVVTTASRGGRDEFFDDEYVFTAEATVDSVAGGIEEVLRRDIHPLYIRERTLKEICKHRLRFMEEIESIWRLSGMVKKRIPEWSDFFVHKMLRQYSLTDVQNLEKRLRVN